MPAQPADAEQRRQRDQRLDPARLDHQEPVRTDPVEPAVARAGTKAAHGDRVAARAPKAGDQREPARLDADASAISPSRSAWDSPSTWASRSANRYVQRMASTFVRFCAVSPLTDSFGKSTKQT